MEKVFTESCVKAKGLEKRHQNSRGRRTSIEPNHSRRQRQNVRRHRKDKNPANDSNLSDRERIGMERLKKRVQAGELLVTETDKARRFCVLTPKQYIDSGLKHTRGDIEISHDQISSVQKSLVSNKLRL